MNIHFKRGLIWSIVGMVAFAAFYAYMDKWGGGTVRVTYLTLTPDRGWVMPVSYNRWLDIFFWPLAMTVVFWLAYGADETMNKQKHKSNCYWLSLMTGSLLAVGFHLFVGRAILPYMVTSVVVGIIAFLMAEATTTLQCQHGEEGSIDPSDAAPYTVIMQFGFAFGIGITGGILGYGLFPGLLLGAVCALWTVVGNAIAGTILDRLEMKSIDL